MSGTEDNIVCGANVSEFKATLIFFLSIIVIIRTYWRAIRRRLVIEYAGTDEAENIAFKTATANWRASKGGRRASRISFEERLKKQKNFGLFARTKVSHNLHHFGLSMNDVNFKEAFKDVKFVLCGSNAVVMQRVARYISEQLSAPVPYGSRVRNLSKKERFAVFKAGPILCVNCSFGTRMQYDSSLDAELVKELCQICKSMDIDYTTGLTMESNDFYEEEGRLDGGLCAYKRKQQKSYLEKLYSQGVKNMQMGCSCFAAFCKRVNAKAGIVNVCLADRFDEGQYPLPAVKLELYEMMPCEVVVQLMKKQLKPEGTGYL
ncbi:putative uridine phosphorylase [Trichuris suis]|nr:putative uridine phosphorylase [Trichuris suis]